MDKSTPSIAGGSPFAGFPDICKSENEDVEENGKMEPDGFRTGAPFERCLWRELGLHTYIKIAIVVCLFSFLFRNELRLIIRAWLADSSWSHGFLIPLFSLYFVNQNKADILNLRTKPSYFGLVLLICGILLYPFNLVHLQYGYLSSLDMIATLGAIVLFLGGWRLLRHCWLPIAFLIFAVPLPDRYYRALTIPMRAWAATVSSALLNLVPGVEATARGVVIDVFYKGRVLEPALDVAEACSGMRLLMAFVALGVAMAYLHRRPLWQRIILLTSTVPIAIFCNIVRVTVTGFIYVLIHPKYAQGIYHDMLGLAMLPLAFALYGLLSLFMSSLFIDDSQILEKDVIVRNRAI